MYWAFKFAAPSYHAWSIVFGGGPHAANEKVANRRAARFTGRVIAAPSLRATRPIGRLREAVARSIRRREVRLAEPIAHVAIDFLRSAKVHVASGAMGRRANHFRHVDLDAMQITVTRQLKSGVEKERT